MLDFIALPSGVILNLSQIAWIAAKDGGLAVHFAAANHSVTLDVADAAALLDALGQRRVNTNATRKVLATP